MLDGFFTGSKWASNKTEKQKLEERIRNSVLNLIIDRDQSFLKTARQKNTSIIVNNRDGGIQKFMHIGREFLSFPSTMEKEFENMDEDDAELKMDSLIKLATTNVGNSYEANQEKDMLEDHENVYKSITGLDSGFKYEFDVDGNITNNPFECRVNKSNEENKEDVDDGKNGDKGSTTLTSKGIGEDSDNRNVKPVDGTIDKREYKFEDTDLSLDSVLPEELEGNVFFSTKTWISEKREHQLQTLASKIVKSFKGRISKQRTMIPSKKLVSKALCIDLSERIYQNKKGENGKHLNINLIIDMSGSMNGKPVKNAIEMIYIFNEVASQGYLTGSVMWSESSSRCKAKFPMPRAFIKKMGKTGASEGLGKNLQHFIDELKQADANICMTDGQLADDPIIKSMYAKERVEIIGVYVNEEAKDLTQYTGSLERWFTTSLVRHTVDELCEKLVQLGLRKKK